MKITIEHDTSQPNHYDIRVGQRAGRFEICYRRAYTSDAWIVNTAEVRAHIVRTFNLSEVVLSLSERDILQRTATAIKAGATLAQVQKIVYSSIITFDRKEMVA